MLFKCHLSNKSARTEALPWAGQEQEKSVDAQWPNQLMESQRFTRAAVYVVGYINECRGTGQTGTRASRGWSYYAATTRGMFQSVSSLSLSEGEAGMRTLANIRQDSVWILLSTLRCGRTVGLDWNSWVAHLQSSERFCPGCESLRQVINRGQRDTHSISADEHCGISPFALVEAGVVHNPLSGQCKWLERNKTNALDYMQRSRMLSKYKMYSTKLKVA